MKQLAEAQKKNKNENSITGEIRIRSGIEVGYLPQEPYLDENKTVQENIYKYLSKARELLDRYEEITVRFQDPEADIDRQIHEQAEQQYAIDESNGWDLDRRIEVVVEALRCPPLDYKVSLQSGGEKRRVAQCGLLLQENSILLLDEPTNHLDPSSVIWLENYLQKYNGLSVVITHDRYFLNSIAQMIFELDNNTIYTVNGNYMHWLNWRKKRLNIQENNIKSIQLDLQNISQKKDTITKKSFEKRQNKQQELKELYHNKCIESGSFVIPQGPRQNTKVLDINNIGISYNDTVIVNDKGNKYIRTQLSGRMYTNDELIELKKKKKDHEIRWLFKNVTFKVYPGQVIGVIGPNGIGKTTLLRIQLKEKIPTEGTVDIGQSVVFGYNSQSRIEQDDNLPLYQDISQGNDYVKVDDNITLPIRTYIAQFNFRGKEQTKQIKHLSGGERNRAHLAKTLKCGANVLLLDEPTNDLDMETLENLENAINGFQGSIIVVSHDRWFLDRVCTDILAFYEVDDIYNPGKKCISSEFFPGNYTQFLNYFQEKYGKDYITVTSLTTKLLF